MLFKILAVRDRAADVFGIPYFAQSTGQAIRGFSDEINRQAQDNQLYNHPEDFDLYLLGEYSDESADWDIHGPKQIAIGKDLSLRLRS